MAGTSLWFSVNAVADTLSQAWHLEATDLGHLTSAVQPKGYPEEQMPEIAFAGRSNVGKSSLMNRLLDQERVIVTDVPGTTRDDAESMLREALHDTFDHVHITALQPTAPTACDFGAPNPLW